jgi:hypothetical protein
VPTDTVGCQVAVGFTEAGDTDTLRQTVFGTALTNTQTNQAEGVRARGGCKKGRREEGRRERERADEVEEERSLLHFKSPTAGQEGASGRGRESNPGS